MCKIQYLPTQSIITNSYVLDENSIFGRFTDGNEFIRPTQDTVEENTPARSLESSTAKVSEDSFYYILIIKV